MSVLVVGISHKSAPVELLEKLALDTDGTVKLVTDAMAGEHVSEATAIVTCNRLELYAEVDRFHGSVEALSAEGVDRAAVARMLQTAAIAPVITAHPTEVRRKSVLDRAGAIAAALTAWEQAAESARNDREAELLREVAIFWRTRLLRGVRLGVIDEIETAVSYFERSFLSELPKLLERAGPGTDEGTITGLFTVLVDGDDHNEPVADAVRGILDGHIVMERAIAERGRFPAINVLKSISRTMPGCQHPMERELVREARGAMAAYSNMEELIRIGAYRAGSDPQTDRAIALNPALEAFLMQDKDEATSLDDAFAQLSGILASELEVA